MCELFKFYIGVTPLSPINSVDELHLHAPGEPRKRRLLYIVPIQIHVRRYIYVYVHI